MNIALDCRLMHRRTSGIGIYNYHLVKELSKLDHINNYRMILNDCVGCKPALLSCLPSNFEAVNIPLQAGILDRLILYTGFPKIDWFTGRNDIIHGTSFFPWPKESGKFIATVHDLAILRIENLVTPKLQEYYEKCLRKYIPNADFVIADSESTRLDVLEIFKIPESRIKVIYLGYDPDFVNCDSKSTISVKIGAPYILFVGTLEPRKNLVALIKAFNILKENYRIPHKLVLAGNIGWLYEPIFLEIELSPYSSDIIAVTDRTDEELVALYKGASVFTLVSLYEGFGLPLLEAMGVGTPVVYANNSSLPEIAGDSGMPVDASNIESIADGIFKVLDNSALSGALSNKGMERAAQFTWEKTARETHKVYEEVGNQDFPQEN
ncbi:MAG: hypothetical protein CO189_04600 [candidate division Zixibacteria bacterium CG_4_9_14_3_um_filter_46_8]|nr:MAG: hypothetical protein CO189_04600 [candidate division Zixibacteria bacterium CG_4_9_14_3_um_filter_46_8]